MAHFKHYLEVFRHHLNCFWPFQWKWKENVIFNKICLLFWTPFCNWPYSGHIYYLENVPVGPISPVWPLNVIWDFKNLIWSRKISIEIVLLLRHCAPPTTTNAEIGYVILIAWSLIDIFLMYLRGGLSFFTTVSKFYMG